jgi:hypothetical protein
MTPEELAEHILGLTAPELIRLNEILYREGGGPVGVREPRRTPPKSPGDEIADELPEDYWETAQ